MSNLHGQPVKIIYSPYTLSRPNSASATPFSSPAGPDPQRCPPAATAADDGLSVYDGGAIGGSRGSPAMVVVDVRDEEWRVALLVTSHMNSWWREKCLLERLKRKRMLPPGVHEATYTCPRFERRWRVRKLLTGRNNYLVQLPCRSGDSLGWEKTVP